MPGQGVRTPGAILHFVQLRGQTTAFYLGTAVLAPKPASEKYEIPVMNDLGGRSARFQSIQDGEEWRVFTTLNRFDLNLLRSIRALGNGMPPGTFPPGGIGTETGQARGTCVIGISDFSLVLVNSYAGTPASGQPVTAGADLNSARGFASCSLMGYEESTEGTRVLEVALAIQCRNVFNPVTRGFTLYYEGAAANLGPVT